VSQEKPSRKPTTATTTLVQHADFQKLKRLHEYRFTKQAPNEKFRIKPNSQYIQK